MSPFITDFIKQVISSVITDINLMNTFTKGIIFEDIRNFFQLVNIPANVILPHYSNLLKVDNILNILFILRILPLYYKDISKEFWSSLFQRMIIDINDEKTTEQ